MLKRQRPINKRHISEDGKYLLDIRDAVAAIGSYEKLQEVAERVVHLKQIDDGLHLFPKGSEFLQQHWRDNNIEKLSQLLQNINQNLEQAGYSKIQILSTRSSAGLNNIDECIRDVVEHKGEGLYAFMCKSVSDYQNQLIYGGLCDIPPTAVFNTPPLILRSCQKPVRVKHCMAYILHGLYFVISKVSVMKQVFLSLITLLISVHCFERLYPSRMKSRLMKPTIDEFGIHHVPTNENAPAQSFSGSLRQKYTDVFSNTNETASFNLPALAVQQNKDNEESIISSFINPVLSLAYHEDGISKATLYAGEQIYDLRNLTNATDGTEQYIASGNAIIGAGGIESDDTYHQITKRLILRLVIWYL